MRFSRIGRWARWGWLATTFAMGIALMATSWASHRRIQRAASTLNRGQSEVLLETIRQYFRDAEPLIAEANLDSLLTAREASGIRYIGLYDGSRAALSQHSNALIESGTATGDPRPPVFP